MNLEKFINATKEADPNYYRMTLEQRLDGGKGSTYDGIDKIETIENLILGANWEERFHPAILNGCRGFVTTDIPGGRFNMIEIDKMQDDVKLHVVNNKKTGMVSLTVAGDKGVSVSETWLIVGVNDGVEMMFTFYPGEPIAIGETTVEELPEGTILTKAEALSRGFHHAKLDPSL